MSNLLRICKPDDFHLHVRQGPVLGPYVRQVARQFASALIMPNTLPPVRTVQDAQDYRREILAAAQPVNPAFKAWMSFKIQAPAATDDAASLRQACRDLKAAGVVAGKLYPQGVTTNSEDGVGSLEELFPLLAAMEAEGLLLLVHGEHPEAFCLDREEAFLPQLQRVVEAFPRLRLVLEHVSTARAVEWVRQAPDRVGATVTVHHLLLTLDDLLGNHLNPHLFCKPLLKRPEDRQALAEAVLGQDGRFFFGSDSAPHVREKKECACGAAGVYTAPVALPLLAGFFERHGQLARLEDFVALRGRAFYGLDLDLAGRGTLELLQESWTVPALVDEVVPLGAGKVLDWKVVDHE